MNFGEFVWLGHGTGIDLFAAAANSLNGALLARRPDHYRNWTVIGILGMGLLMGLGGGITRDVILSTVPDALMNPAYMVVCIPATVLGYLLAYRQGEFFREGLFQLVTAFSLVWYAIAGAEKATAAGVPALGVLVISVVGPTAGRWYVDVSSGVPPKQFVRGQWFVPTALIAGGSWMLLHGFGIQGWTAALIAFVPAYLFRVLALYYWWDEPLANEPQQVYQPDSPHPLWREDLRKPTKQEREELDLEGEAPKPIPPPPHRAERPPKDE